jgi:hypothetical protein
MAWNSIICRGRAVASIFHPLSDSFEKYGYVPMTKEALWALAHHDVGEDERLVMALASAFSGMHSESSYHDCRKTFLKGVCCADDEQCEAIGHLVPTTPHVLWAIVSRSFSIGARRLLAAILWETWGQNELAFEGGMKTLSEKIPFLGNPDEIKDSFKELHQRNILKLEIDLMGTIKFSHKLSISPDYIDWDLSQCESDSLMKVVGNSLSSMYFPEPKSVA